MNTLQRTLGAILCSLLLTTPALGQGFGGAVAASGGDVLVGEPQNQITPGAVYVYRRGDSGAWLEQARLTAPDAHDGDGFGQALAVDGEMLLVGAAARNDGAGAAYLFRRSGGAWTQAARLVANDEHPGGRFGSAVALSGDVALVGAPGEGDNAGAAYAFRRHPDGSWSLEARLELDGAQARDGFGSALALEGNAALIGAPGRNRFQGAVLAYERSGTGEWTGAGPVTPGSHPERSGYGATVAMRDGVALVGAPNRDNAAGGVYVFRHADGAWQEGATLQPFDPSARSLFGGAIAFDGDRAWIGTPGAAAGEGRTYVARHDAATGAWSGMTKLGSREPVRRARFGGALAVSDGIAVAGLPGDDFGAGTAIVLERDAAGGWSERAKISSEPASFDPVLGAQVDCDEGHASAFDCSEVDLVSFVPVKDIGGSRGVRVNDLWGWTDPASGREYAIVGRLDGTSFVDVSDPYHPRYLGDLPMTETATWSSWRDMKVYRDHAFIVSDGAGQHGMQVFDLTELRGVGDEPVTFGETAHYDGIFSAHNIVINEAEGFAYAVGSSGGGETCGGGLHMIDIRDPANPTFAGCFADASTGRRGTGYTHDAQCVTYQGPDAEHRGKQICFGANETALSIADVSDKDAPVALSMASYPNVGYSHQGWLTEDHRHFFMNDELDELAGSVEGTRTLIWDVTDLDDPVLVREYVSDNGSSDHNLYIRDGYMYQSNYVSGLRIFDVRDVENPVPVGFFDTVPYGEDAPGFNGSWSNYPFFASGIIVVNSGREGLFILKKRPQEIIP